MYSNIRVIKLNDKENAIRALRSVVTSMDHIEAYDVISKAPGVILRGVFNASANRIKKVLEGIGAEVVIE